MRVPEETIEYGWISEQKPKCTVWTKTFGEAVEMAKADQPAYRPWYIVEKTEHFEICGVVEDEEHE